MSPKLMSTISLEQSLGILNYTRSIYPAIIFGLFLISFITFGVINAPDDGDKVRVEALRGPGGRPLPTRRKSANQVKDANAIKDFSPRAKMIFTGLQAGVLMAFVANGVAVILQVIWYRKDEWWPGQSAVVSLQRFRILPIY